VIPTDISPAVGGRTKSVALIGNKGLIYSCGVVVDAITIGGPDITEVQGWNCWHPMTWINEQRVDGVNET